MLKDWNLILRIKKIKRYIKTNDGKQEGAKAEIFPFTIRSLLCNQQVQLTVMNNLRIKGFIASPSVTLWQQARILSRGPAIMTQIIPGENMAIRSAKAYSTDELGYFYFALIQQ